MTTNLKQYCNVVVAAVVGDHQLLPANYMTSTGVQKMNINNSDEWSDAQLILIEWYPYVLVDVGTPGPYYTRSLSLFDIQPTQVVQTAEYTQLDIEVVRSSKNRELENSITLVSANDLALDDQAKYLVQDDKEWVALEQSKLARLDDWQAVADFDTSKPVVLPLSNTYVGAQYVSRGTELTADNEASVASGSPVPYDPAILSSWIAGNRAAADDSSGDTPTIDPPFDLRQAVSVVSQGSSEIWLYRYQRADVDPVTDFNYRIKLITKTDLQPLYVFAYTTNGVTTFLAWHQMTLQPDGSWVAEGVGAEWQYVPGDMQFIFSYGTNPAVEADFFTKPVQFPAGVNEMVHRIRWNRGVRIPARRR